MGRVGRVSAVGMMKSKKVQQVCFTGALSRESKEKGGDMFN